MITEIGELRPGAAETVIDARGGALLPGLHDHHLHLLSLAAADASVRCGPPHVADRDGLARVLREAPGRWVRGIGYHESVAGMLDRHALDRLVSDRPVRIQHRSGGLWTLNTRALAELGLLDDHDDGRLWRADTLLRDRLGDQQPPGLAAAGRRLASLGITGVTDATSELSDDAIRLLTGASLPQRLQLLGAQAGTRLPEGGSGSRSAATRRSPARIRGGPSPRRRPATSPRLSGSLLGRPSTACSLRWMIPAVCPGGSLSAYRRICVCCAYRSVRRCRHRMRARSPSRSAGVGSAPEPCSAVSQSCVPAVSPRGGIAARLRRMSPDAPTMADEPLLGDIGQVAHPLLVVDLDASAMPSVQPSDRLLIGVATGPPDVTVALDLESFAYSTLLGGAEFARWLQRRGPRRPPPSSSQQPVLLDRAASQLRITLNRPERRNAYGREVRDALVEALRLAASDDSIEQVVLDGAGPSFSSGGDLDEFGTTPDLATAHFVRTRAGAARLLYRLSGRLEARVHGSCVGAGIELPAFAGRDRPAGHDLPATRSRDGPHPRRRRHSLHRPAHRPLAHPVPGPVRPAHRQGNRVGVAPHRRRRVAN
jgi:Amidohydrolase family/Enoyl-CoA hydratase/isomerase